MKKPSPSIGLDRFDDARLLNMLKYSTFMKDTARANAIRQELRMRGLSVKVTSVEEAEAHWHAQWNKGLNRFLPHPPYPPHRPRILWAWEATARSFDLAIRYLDANPWLLSADEIHFHSSDGHDVSDEDIAFRVSIFAHFHWSGRCHEPGLPAAYIRESFIQEAIEQMLRLCYGGYGGRTCGADYHSEAQRGR